LPWTPRTRVPNVQGVYPKNGVIIVLFSGKRVKFAWLHVIT